MHFITTNLPKFTVEPLLQREHGYDPPVVTIIM